MSEWSQERVILKDDIGQQTKLADKHPGRAKSMRSLPEKIREQGYSAPRLTARSRG